MQARKRSEIDNHIARLVVDVILQGEPLRAGRDAEEKAALDHLAGRKRQRQFETAAAGN